MWSRRSKGLVCGRDAVVAEVYFLGLGMKAQRARICAKLPNCDENPIVAIMLQIICIWP